MARISSEDDLKAWLDALPQMSDAEKERARRIAVTLAHRSAMRVLPLAGGWSVASLKTAERDLTVSPLFWSSLISGCAAGHPHPEIRNAAYTAARAARDSARAAASKATANAAKRSAATVPAASVAAAELNAAIAALAAASAADACTAATSAASITANIAYGTSSNAADATDAHAAAWAAVDADRTLFETGEDPLDAPLWHEAPNPFEDAWTSLKARLSTRPAPEGWQFWIDWYDRALTGARQKWTFLTQVALIDETHWRAGPAAVWEQIEKLESPRTRAPIQPQGNAIAQNLPALQVQIAALVNMLDNEIECLRGKNLQDDVEQAEIQRLRETFTSMRTTLFSLSEQLEQAPDDPDELVADVKPLLEVFADEATAWPRENAADLVDGTARVGIVGLASGILIACGLPGWPAFAVAGFAFGGKKLVGVGKVAKDVAGGDG